MACVDTVDENHELHQQNSLNSWSAPMLFLRWGTLSTKQGIEVVDEGGESQVSYRPNTPPIWIIRLVGRRRMTS